ncbi:MAG: transketolase [Oscillospiraceae bacterium]|nr:transketolase [Oscillospiraceae bacterium]
MTSIEIRTLSRLGQRGAVFTTALPAIAENRPNIKLLTADLALLSGMSRFKAAHPEKLINIGIAEQNMIGIAAGLAMEGDCVFATTYASFIAVRSLEQVRQHLSHLKCNIKLIGSSAGVQAAKSGVSHWATEDIAFTRALPNLTVLSAADALEAVKLTEYAASTTDPVYIRLSGGLNCPVVYKEDFDFVPNKLKKLREGSDAVIIATGSMVVEALCAADILSGKGIEAAVYDMHTIKPLDKEGLSEIFGRYPLVVTAEEHQISGGMGSAVAEYKAGFRNAPPQIFIGFNDTFADAGSPAYVRRCCGLTAENIAERTSDGLHCI